MDDEQPHQELVKCVLVGDNAVGKTRLICARACRQKVSLSQLLNTHVPTVWAIDQYRIYKEVLENSMMVLDGVNVSLRLWDTFGDHHKDRRFAYGRSDVVLMCFDIGRRSSLDNCLYMWHAQIKKFCPNTPIILVGCKSDVRFICKDEQYLNYCKDRSPLVRQVRERDLVMPDQGRAVAKELGDLPYYETSVLTYFGVNEVFENAIRAALCSRRQQRFWMTNLKRISAPRLQEPHCPPRPELPKLSQSHFPSQFSPDKAMMLRDQHFADVIVLCGSVGFSAHRFMLSAASPFLYKLFRECLEHQDQQQQQQQQQAQTPPTRCTSETSLLSCGFADTECLLKPPPHHHLSPSQSSSSSAASTPMKKDFGCIPSKALLSKRRRSASFHLTSAITAHWGKDGFRLERQQQHKQPQQHQQENFFPDVSEVKPGYFRYLGHPAVESVSVQTCESLDGNGKIVCSVQSVVTCSKMISAREMDQVIKFIYTGEVDENVSGNGADLSKLKEAAEFLNVPDLFAWTDVKMAEKADDDDLILLQRSTLEMSLISLSNCGFADVYFRLDDGSTVAAHKPALMARCDVMRAMFSHADFVERSAKVVRFPGVSRRDFEALLFYLYSDRISDAVSPVNCVGLIELANRLCLPRLVALVEVAVVARMEAGLLESEDEAVDDALKILQPSQVHNAEQLSEWCLSYLSQTYNHVCRKYPKVLRSLYPENQAFLNVHRWPPIWYLKDYDYYQRMQQERDRLERPLKRRGSSGSGIAGSGGTGSGCLCFSSNKSRKGSYIG